ncbi:MAG: hypothetical protein KF691_01915 [Phycisphaeraceae bacterium]|nr:hypothetical protein [Phycisphaeraceae bacterium]
MMRFGNVSFSLLLIPGAALLVGCTAQPSDIRVQASEYNEAFTAARDVLHSYRFPLDRIDARAGVLTTRTSASAGFLTPWTGRETTMSQAWEDTIHNQQRRVEVVFTPTDAPEAELRTDQAREATADFVEKPQETNAHVKVVIERTYQFGWRPNTRSTYLSSLTEDSQPGVPSRVQVDISDDPYLAGRIAADIRKLIAKRANTKPAGAEEPMPPNP